MVILSKSRKKNSHYRYKQAISEFDNPNLIAVLRLILLE
jgi:hypothetical protein